MVAQHKAHIEHYARQADGSWLLREMGAGRALALPSVAATVEVDAIYRRVFELPG